MSRPFTPMNNPPYLPWYLDTCNLSEVIVKDSRGNVVHYEDLGGIPDEFSSSMREAAVQEAHANAHAMVEWSNGRDLSPVAPRTSL